MFERSKAILDSNTSDLRKLAEAAGADYRTFWIDADLSNVDIKGQDLGDFDLSRAKLDSAIMDAGTRLPANARISAATKRRLLDEHRKAEERKGDGPSLDRRIAPHIPYLRRYARALAGSQARGDAYVAAVLEALITQPSLFDLDLPPRVALYKLFSSLWQAVDVNIRDDAPVSAWEERSTKNLRAISPLPRQAFLLVAVEGFSTAEAATILSIDEAGFSTLIDQASSDISRQVSAKIMIIEDEPLIAMDLEQMAETLGHSVTGIARSRSQAVSLAEANPPSLILADIQLADGSSGIDAVKEILKKADVPAIFITAFPERLLTADRPEPTYLITKPFNPHMVKAMISQVLFFR